MKALVCGGRRYDDERTVGEVLSKLGVSTLVCGGAAGADSLAIAWAIETGVPTIVHEPNWTRLGARAGNVRNSEMLKENREEIDCIVAFPGGRGTHDMVCKGLAADVLVLRVMNGSADGVA